MDAIPNRFEGLQTLNQRINSRASRREFENLGFGKIIKSLTK